MPLIKDHIKGLASRLYLKAASSDNRQIREFGQYEPMTNTSAPDPCFEAEVEILLTREREKEHHFC
jgi:hypothetical protein